ncbi:MAG TPA: hypothetical protein VG944_07810 [Fimbriimonas sp.]|nr:hypothetical protein [Fimbriimonas sp.]
MSETLQDYKAAIDANAAEAEIKRIQKEIDDLQDQLDAHNAQVKIDLDVDE